MGEKVTFDPVTRIIQIDTAPVAEGTDFVVDIDIQQDIYSDGKEDWLANESLRRLKFPVRAVGGDPLPGSKILGDTYFLASDWKIAPYEANHRLRVNGNFYSEDGTSPFNITIGNYNVFLEHQVSTLVDSTIAQLAEIEYASFNGGVTIDTNNTSGKAVAGIEYPTGTPQEPSDNIDDANTIADARGLKNFYVLENLHLTSTIPPLDDGHSFIGEGKDRTTITIDTDANVEDCAYYEAEITGTLDGNSLLQDCIISNLIYVKGFVEQCVLSSGTIELAGSEVAHFLDCWSGQIGVGTPVIDMGGAGQALALRNYNGGIKLINKTGSDSVSIDLNSGQIIIDDTVTNGTIILRGVGKWTNKDIYIGGANVIDELVDGRELSAIHEAHFNKRVWDKNGETITIYDTDGVTALYIFDTNADMSLIDPQ